MQCGLVGALDAQEMNPAHAVDDEGVAVRHLGHALRPRGGGQERDDERRNHRLEDAHVPRVPKRGVAAYSWSTYATVLALLGLVATLAAYLPARCAARVEPLIALRQDSQSPTYPPVLPSLRRHRRRADCERARSQTHSDHSQDIDPGTLELLPINSGTETVDHRGPPPYVRVNLDYYRDTTKGEANDDDQSTDSLEEPGRDHQLKRRGVFAAASAMVAAVVLRKTTEPVQATSGTGPDGNFVLGSNDINNTTNYASLQRSWSPGSISPVRRFSK